MTKEKIKKVLVVGANGIGSWFCFKLNNGFKKEWDGLDLKHLSIDVMDKDKIETKNFGYTSYDVEHFDMEKSDAISELYGFKPRVEWLETTDQLNGYDLIILAVDNNKARRLVAESGKPFIDMRAKGREVFVMFVDNDNVEEYLKLTPQNEKKGSCQYGSDIDQLRYQNGNDISASIGYQMFLNKLRGEIFPRKIILRC